MNYLSWLLNWRESILKKSYFYNIFLPILVFYNINFNCLNCQVLLCDCCSFTPATSSSSDPCRLCFGCMWLSCSHGIDGIAQEDGVLRLHHSGASLPSHRDPAAVCPAGPQYGDPRPTTHCHPGRCRRRRPVHQASERRPLAGEVASRPWQQGAAWHGILGQSLASSELSANRSRPKQRNAATTKQTRQRHGYMDGFSKWNITARV